MLSQVLYARMKSENDFMPVLSTAVRECGIKNILHAEKMLDAFLQWFSLIPSLKQGETLQMIRTVDPIWHAFILNTKFYRDFCNTYCGQFIDHDPTDIDEEAGKAVYADFTLHLLKKAFPNSLNKHLLSLEDGVTCCTVCSDIGGGDDGGVARSAAGVKDAVRLID